jgi:hypothetical protein
MAGIGDSYYLAIADDLSEEDIEKKLAELRKLCHSISEVA